VHRNTAFEECVDRSRPATSIVGVSDDGEGMFGLIQKPAPAGRIGAHVHGRPTEPPDR
jgi:hypothetical protein